MVGKKSFHRNFTDKLYCLIAVIIIYLPRRRRPDLTGKLSEHWTMVTIDESHLFSRIKEKVYINCLVRVMGSSRTPKGRFNWTFP